MKKILFLITMLFLFQSSKMMAQPDYVKKQKADQLFKTTDIVYFKFPVHSTSEIPQVSKIISFDKSQGMIVFAHADKPQFTKFLEMNYAYTVLPPPQSKKSPATTNEKPPVKKKKVAANKQ